MTQDSPADVCRQVIADTHAFYRQHHNDLGNRGYHVMYGPPIHRPPVLFIGFQPGGDRTEEHLLADPSDTWPETSYYATEDWKLARIMRSTFGEALLRQSTGTNAFFFRSPSVDTFLSEVPGATLVMCDQFCQSRLRQIIESLQPKRIVCIGFATLRRFGLTYPVLSNGSGRALVEEGSILGFPALATLHLSGSRIAANDLQDIGSFILKKTDEDGI